MTEGRQIEMKMAKAGDDNIRLMSEFFEFLERYAENAESLLDDEDGLDYEDVVDRINTEFSRLTRRATVAGAWRRVVWGFQILRDNCCDPDANTLEWNPELKALIEAAESPALDPHPFTADAWQLQEA
jgi:hypothetical protein